MTPKTKQAHSLILATDPVLSTLTDAVTRILVDIGQQVLPPMFIRGIGEALRQLHVSPPGAVFVCTSRQEVESGAAIIDQLHRRLPQMPMLAVAEHHDEHVERSVRVAGATYYFPLEGAQDEQQLRRALQMLGMAKPAAPPGAARSPPRPPVRRRSRVRDGPPRTYQS